MIAYDALKHEMLILQWHLNLKTDPEEYDKLFADSTHTLTSLLHWATSTVMLAFEMDKDGVWAACWVEPCLNAVWFGSWIRRDKRHTKSALKFINEAYARVLDKFPTILGLTSQPKLADLHIKLGYKFGCRVPGMFNGKDALIFIMTRESREARHERSSRRIRPRRENIVIDEQHAESLRPVLGQNGAEVVSGREQLHAAVSGAIVGSSPNGGSKRPNPSGKRKPRVRKNGGKFKHERHSESSLPSGAS